ncbi:MAG TPA: LysR family transcriptional regulator [Pseudolysinimonas sp.]|nr:LysR family transcriptional regulator [Pseudolysinimonas sp.]
MPRFTLRQLEHFRAVAEARSFSAAAESLMLSPSAVSASITELERSLGTQLFVRKKAQGVTVTSAGTYLLDEARDLLRRADELQIGVEGDSGKLSGPIRIGCYSTLSATVLPRLIDDFSAQHPEVSITFVDGSMPELEPLLAAGQLDFIITYRINLPPRLTEVVLYRNEVNVLLPADHRLADADSIALSDMADEPLIMLDVPPSGRHTLDMLQAAGIHPEVRYTTTNFELVRSMVGRGLGYTLLMQKPVVNVSYEGLPLVAKRIEGHVSDEFAVIVWASTVRLTERAATLVRFAQESFAH